MKKFRRLPGVMLAFLLLSIIWVSCKPKDSDIQAAIEAKKKEMPDMAGLTASVSKGVVTLTGECKDDAARSSCESAVKGIKGVKEVVNNVTITPPPQAAAPPVIAADDALSKGVADAVKDYTKVRATVQDGVVTLSGDIGRAELTKLMMTLHSLKPKKIVNQLTVK